MLENAAFVQVCVSLLHGSRFEVKAGGSEWSAPLWTDTVAQSDTPNATTAQPSVTGLRECIVLTEHVRLYDLQPQKQHNGWYWTAGSVDAQWNVTRFKQR